MYNYKRITQLIETKIEPLISQIEALNLILKDNLKNTKEAISIQLLRPLFNIKPLLNSLENVLSFTSFLISKWFFENEEMTLKKGTGSLNSLGKENSVFRKCLIELEKRILKEKIAEDLIIHLCELATHFSNQNFPKIPQKVPILKCIFQVCIQFYSLLCIHDNELKEKERKIPENLIVHSFPSLMRVISNDRPDTMKDIPELKETFSFLRTSRQIDFDILLTDLFKKYQDLIYDIIFADKIQKELTRETLITIKRLPWVLGLNLKQRILR